MKKPAYLNHDDEIHIRDFTLIMDSIGEFSYISTRVLQDVVDELQAEIDNRQTEPATDEPETDEQSVEEMHAEELAVFNRTQA